MPNARYFLGLGGSFLLGLGVIVAAIIVTWLSLPYLLPIMAATLPSVALILGGALLVILIFIAIVIAIYIITMIGVFIQYLFKPMKVSKEPKGYNVATIKESGRRERRHVELQKAVKPEWEKGETTPISKTKPKPITMDSLKTTKKKKGK